MVVKVQRGQWWISGGRDYGVFTPERNDASSHLYMCIYHGIALLYRVHDPQLQAACLAILRYHLTATKS